MEAIIKGKTEIFKNLFKTTAVLIPEARFNITQEGVSFNGMGLSHIDMLIASYPASDFEVFKTSEKISFGVRLEDVVKLVNMADEDMELSIGDSRLILKSGRKRFDTRLIEAEHGKEDMPNVPFSAKIVLDYSVLLDALETVAVQAEHIYIQKEQDKPLLFYGEGDTGRAEIEPEVISVEGEGKGFYSLKDLKKFASTYIVPKGKKENVTINFGTKMPVRFDLGRISYFHAPRVND